MPLTSQGTGMVEERKGISFGESRLNFRDVPLEKLGSILHGNMEWSQAETSLHINCLKLPAGAFAIKTFTKGNS